MTQPGYLNKCTQVNDAKRTTKNIRELLTQRGHLENYADYSPVDKICIESLRNQDT